MLLQSGISFMKVLCTQLSMSSPSPDLQRLREAIALLKEKLQSKTFIKAIGGSRTAEALRLIVEYAEKKLSAELESKS